MSAPTSAEVVLQNAHALSYLIDEIPTPIDGDAAEFLRREISKNQRDVAGLLEYLALGSTPEPFETVRVLARAIRGLSMAADDLHHNLDRKEREV